MKRCTEGPASGSQVERRTERRELWNEPVVFTEMNTSDNKTGEGTGDASPMAIKPIIRVAVAANIVSLLIRFRIFLSLRTERGHHRVFPLQQYLLY